MGGVLPPLTEEERAMVNGDASAFNGKQSNKMSGAYEAVCERVHDSLPDLPEERLRSMAAEVVIDLAMQPDCDLDDIVSQATARLTLALS
jgi:hypothetical protein